MAPDGKPATAILNGLLLGLVMNNEYVAAKNDESLFAAGAAYSGDTDRDDGNITNVGSVDARTCNGNEAV